MKNLLIAMLLLSGVAVGQTVYKPYTAYQLRTRCKAFDSITTYDVTKDASNVDKTPITTLAAMGNDSGFCQGFVLGMMLTVDGTYSAEVNLNQAVRVFEVYIDKHPELENQPAAAIAKQSLREAGLVK